ncbi:MAG: VWA domain-containing protein [Phycisphaerae bacterium]
MTEWLAERFQPGPLFAWLCLIFVALVPLIWVRARGARRRATVRFSSLRPFRLLGTTWAKQTRFVLPLLRTLAVLALIIALARPQSGGEYRSTSEGIAIQMVLDVSGSMSEGDFILGGRRVRRLDAVKRVFRDFVLGKGLLQGRENDLIGMTTFAMYADTRCPLTLDHGSLSDLLDETEIPGWVDGRQVREQQEAGYTALGDAIVLATDDLRRAGEQAVAGVPGAEAAKSRVMILLTDGADNPAPFRGSQPPNPIEAAKVAATLGIKVYTIGAVGSAGPRRSSFGFLLQSRAQVDEVTLKEIARVTGGSYFRATDTNSLEDVYDEIDRLERRRTGERTYHDNIFAAKVAMLTGLALLMAELALVNTRYRTIP